jgi:hypothetical protein
MGVLGDGLIFPSTKLDKNKQRTCMQLEVAAEQWRSTADRVALRRRLLALLAGLDQG